MAPKRAASPSAPSSSASKRVKAEPSHSTDDDVIPDVKPDIKPKLEDYTPSVTSISRNWLLHSDPAKLEALLLDACRLYPAFDAKVAASVEENAAMLAGDGDISDFKIEIGKVETLARRISKEGVWVSIHYVIAIDLDVSLNCPLLMKMNALRALVTIIIIVKVAIRRQDGFRCEFESDSELHPDNLQNFLQFGLLKMTNVQRRLHIDAKLVEQLDSLIDSKGTRALYGEEGRELGEIDRDYWR